MSLKSPKLATIDSPTIHSIKTGNIESLKFLLDRGADINEEDGNGRTPLFYALTSDASVGIIKILLERGADPDKKDYGGYTPLMHALILENDISILHLLLDKVKNIDIFHNKGYTYLTYAISENLDTSIIELLIDRGADVNKEDGNGNAPLFVAFHSNTRKEIVELLIKKGADINHRDENGSTPIMFAISSGMGYLVNYLIKNGADINITDSDGDTVLSIALIMEVDDYIIEDILINRPISVEKEKYHLLRYLLEKDYSLESILSFDELKPFRGMALEDMKNFFKYIYRDEIYYIKPMLENFKNQGFLDYVESIGSMDIFNYVVYLIKTNIKEKFGEYQYLSEIVCNMQYVLSDIEIQILRHIYSIDSSDRKDICLAVSNILEQKTSEISTCNNDTFILGDEVKDSNINGLFSIVNARGVKYCFNDEDIEDVIRKAKNPWTGEKVPDKEVKRLNQEFGNYLLNRLDEGVKEPIVLKKIDKLWNMLVEEGVEIQNIKDIRKMNAEELEDVSDKFNDIYKASGYYIKYNEDEDIHRINIITTMINLSRKGGPYNLLCFLRCYKNKEYGNTCCDTESPEDNSTETTRELEADLPLPQ